MIEEIIKMADKVRKDIKSNLPLLEKEIDSIIENKVKSSEKIEIILDTLLDYLYAGVGESQFKKLNSYYHSFCPEFSKDYENFYSELRDR